MSRFSGPQHKGAQAITRSERRAEAEARNSRTVPARRRQYRLNPPTDTAEVNPYTGPMLSWEEPAEFPKRKRGKK